MFRNNCCRFQFYRHFSSAWIKENSSSLESVENIFINENVQALLKSLTGFDLKNKIFSKRLLKTRQRKHYALMNDEMLQQAMRPMEERGKRMLQFVPVKEPRPNSYHVLAKDEKIAKFDTAKFIFTDISEDTPDRKILHNDRLVVVREPDGTLRTALPEEQDRMNRVYYEQDNRPVNEPPLFSEPNLSIALSKNLHEFVLDYACHFFEPDNSRFVEVCHNVYDEIALNDKFEFLYSTRHFGPLVFYLTINDNLDSLRKFLERAKTKEAADVASPLDKLNELKSAVEQLKSEGRN